MHVAALSETQRRRIVVTSSFKHLLKRKQSQRDREYRWTSVDTTKLVKKLQELNVKQEREIQTVLEKQCIEHDRAITRFGERPRPRKIPERYSKNFAIVMGHH